MLLGLSDWPADSVMGTGHAKRSQCCDTQRLQSLERRDRAALFCAIICMHPSNFSSPSPNETRPNPISVSPEDANLCSHAYLHSTARPNFVVLPYRAYIALEG
jgi:hypothetical protein